MGKDELIGELSRVPGKDAGVYEITAGTITNENNPNYNVIVIGNTLTINRKSIIVKAKSQWKTYGDLDPKFTYEVTGLVEGDELTGKLRRATGEDVGDYLILAGTVTSEYNKNYAITFVSGKFTIVKKKVNVTANDVTKTYGEDDPTFTYTATGVLSKDTLTGSLSRVAGEDAGTYAITLGTLSGGKNYTLSFQGATLKINAKDITVKANDLTKTYGDADPELTYTVEGLVGSDRLTGTLSRTAGENVGTYVISEGTLSSNGNYNISFTGGKLTVVAKTITVKANDQKKATGSSDPELTYTVEGLVGSDTLIGALTRAAGEEKGTYDITQGTLSSSENYVINFTGATFTIFEAKVGTDVTVGEDTPKTELGDMNDDKLNSLLTEEEKEALKAGEQVKVYIEVVALDEGAVPADDKAEINAYAKKSGMKVGMYLDLSLFKEVGEGNALAIHDTDGNMFKVTITVPEELRAPNRTFYIVRTHEGTTTVLGESKGDTVTFETDKFSTYALMFKDASSLTWLWIVIAVVTVSVVGFGVYFIIIKKKNGRKEDEVKTADATNE